jgi:transcriptional regulator SbtR-like protein
VLRARCALLSSERIILFRIISTRHGAHIRHASKDELLQRLAGSFASTEELQRQGREVHQATQDLLERTKAAGALRADVEVGDLSLLLEQLQGLRIGDSVRAGQLRHRYLAVILDGLHIADAPQLPSTPPSWQETSRRYDG